MEIDFIKWMCEKAEGFEVKICSLGYEYMWFENYACTNLDNVTITRSWAYPLLLQKAIEGVNIDTTDIEIDCYSDMIQVCRGELLKKQFTHKASYKIDQAKESALKYIYDQERL